MSHAEALQTSPFLMRSTHRWQLLALWTMNAFIVYATYYSGGNINVTAEQADQLSDRDIWVLEYGSKWEFASFFTYCAIICAYNLA